MRKILIVQDDFPEEIHPQGKKLIDKDAQLKVLIEFFKWVHRIQVTGNGVLKFGQVYQQYQKFHMLLDAFKFHRVRSVSNLRDYLTSIYSKATDKYMSIEFLLQFSRGNNLVSLCQQLKGFLKALTKEKLLLLLQLFQKKLVLPKRIFATYKKYRYTMNNIYIDCDQQLSKFCKKERRSSGLILSQQMDVAYLESFRTMIRSSVSQYFNHFNQVFITKNIGKSDQNPIFNIYRPKYKARLMNAQCKSTNSVKPKRRIVRQYGKHLYLKK